MPTKMLKPDMDALPVRVDRGTAAELLTKYYFKVSPRSLERWPLAWRRLNGKAHCETRDLFGLADKMLTDAAPVFSGPRPRDAQHEIAA